ncbi:hypothetical protein AB833_10120 [Chromatiales bacterium (ex Bugula neritina AB1)]|nr:hypothetical protein AB833_10120 [Chromatiales bacterium (ex Bugula neritina AB1)]
MTELVKLIRFIGRMEAQGTTVTVYPDAEEYFQQRSLTEQLQKQVADIRTTAADNPLRRTLLKTELLPYQFEGIQFAKATGRAILADDMGLGKTIQGVGVAELLPRLAGIKKVLVVCPASLKAQWRSEITRFCERDCQVVVGKVANRAEQYSSDAFLPSATTSKYCAIYQI